MSPTDLLVRPPAVAGTFYPARADALAREVDGYLADAAPSSGPAPKVLLVPHAGYVYSGPVAATAYATLAAARDTIERVVLLGPAHFVPLHGVGVTSADAWATPFGLVPIDDEARRAVLEVPGVRVDDRAHAPEHSLEVQLPFLTRVLGEFRLLPLAVGHAEPEVVAAALDRVWGGPETLVVVSSDLSHYLSYDAARAVDRETADAILAGNVARIHPEVACGSYGLRGLLLVPHAHELRARLLDLRSSGDTAGSRDRVVGYGAFAWEGTTS
ncbi:MAG TPA: AmmeMemoRadiSam system protein B [Acidimicrobiia bacterium]|nr:AmmeMemoRadiSam system protein B [Acidimicrobiia bacterium]